MPENEQVPENAGLDRQNLENADRNNRGNFTRNLNKEEDHSIARKMFFGGLCFLPWLWAVNVFFYRKQLVDASIEPRVTICENSSCIYCIIMNT